MWNRYQHRNQILKEMGFDSYADYLKSDLWASLRKQAMKKYHGICQSCGDKATQVHHKHYSRRLLKGEHIIGLKPICKECHKTIEFDENQKVDVVTANQRMKVIGEKNGLMEPFCEICRKNPTKKNKTICGRCKKDGKKKKECI